MNHRVTRRQFVGSSLAAGAMASGYFIHPSAAQESNSPNEKLNLAIVGCGNKGWHNVQELKSQNMVALCDVDSNYLDRAAQAYPDATRHRDFRQMMDQRSNQIDAVVVSTADHTHAPATALALAMGKHVYCEKPLTHTVDEARIIAEMARQAGVATQMGIQIHAGNNYRRVVEIIQSGAIGKVSEVYCWCNKAWAGGKFTASDTPSPPNLDWDLWLGPAAERPYSPSIHPGNWRRFWEYGTGTFGDMACHIVDLPFWALGLGFPHHVTCERPPVDPDGAPQWVKATYDFTLEDGSPLKLHWSDGGAHFPPPESLLDRHDRPLSQWGLGILFVGEEGSLATDYGQHLLYPTEKFADFVPPEKTIPDSIGHWNEWVQACKTGSPTTCNFDYSGAITETVLLGVVAYRSGVALEWDAANLTAKNASEADVYVRKQYRRGWELASHS